MLKPQELVFGRFLEQKRKDLQITQRELAQMLGYKNITKGIRRITDIESGNMNDTLISELMTLLKVSEQDRQSCQLAEDLVIMRQIRKLPPFKPKLIWRAISCVHISEPIPDYLESKSSKVTYAQNFAKAKHCHCRLELDYNLRYWISPDGVISKADRRFVDKKSTRPDLGRII